MSNRPAKHAGDGASAAPAQPQTALARFSPAVRDWFQGAFAAPTPAQSAAWEAISDGGHTLVIAPTGSGKTLSAFLWALDILNRQPTMAAPPAGCQVVYVSPMKALGVDVERNLRAPLVGIDLQARRLGLPERRIRVAVRTGDTPPAERRAFARDPADILITTPESLFLLLTSKARESLTGVRTVIVDEVHAVAASKRGAHLALSLERLDALLDRPAQRIGLSATVRPAQEVARFLAGGRPVHIVDPPSAKAWDLGVVVPVPDLADLGTASEDLSGAASGAAARSSIWPHVEERLVDEITAHRSTLVFANSRRLAERLTARLNEIWEERCAEALVPADACDSGDGGTPGQPDEHDEDDEADEYDGAARAVGAPRTPGTPPAQLMGQAGSSRGAPPILARAHHGSVSKEQRATIEDDLKAGRLPVVVATSSLELGIDMGAIDLVVQVEAPPSVASGLQRVGRAGHQVGAVSRGLFFPKHRADLLSTAVVVERMRAGAIEALRVPANPLDVLAQQIVAMTALDEWTVADLHGAVCRAAPYATLTRPVLESVLDMLAGRYPSEEFAELRPRLVWDRVTDTLRGRPGAQRLAVTSGGTIPDRGLFGVFLAGDGAGRRVGELDEEMVYESRVGDVFTLGTSAWRVEDITHDQVIVAPAPGQPGRLPFWRGDTLGRSAELGAALGAYARELTQLPRAAALARARSDGLDEWAADNLVAYLAEQREAAGVLPDERTIVVERFRDELGDWQIAIHSPYGTPVHAPWALVIAARLRERLGVEVHPMYADDGIVLHLPDADLGETPQDRGADGGALADLVADLTIDPGEVAAAVTAHIGGSAMFAARFRECAARALLLPRRSPGRRQALWQQRQRAAQLLSVASRYPSFPIILESVRECLQDVFDVPALVDLMRDVADRRVRVVAIETPAPSPFARSLLFGYVAHFLYEGDAPLAERRAAALSLDPDLLAELLGGADAADLADLLDPAVLARTEDELQRRAPDRRCRHAEDVADLVRRLGPITADDVRERTDPSAMADVDAWLTAMRDARRLLALRISGVDRWAVVEDAARLRDALGVAPPPGVPDSLLAPVPDPLGDLASRYARTHGPFTAVDLAQWLGVGPAVAADVLARLARADRLASGRLRPPAASDGGAPASTRPPVDYCDPEVLRLLKRRSLAALRAEVEPVEQVDFARFLPAWHSVGGKGRGPEGVASAIEQLTGAVLPASAWESLVLPARVRDYSPAHLDELLASGEVLWQGHGALAGSDGWISFHFADSGSLTLAPPGEWLPADTPRGEVSPGDDPKHRRSQRSIHSLHDVGPNDALDAIDASGAEAPEQTEQPERPGMAPVESTGDLRAALLDLLGSGGAFHVRTLAQRCGTHDLGAVSGILWELTWQGMVSNDSYAPIRALVGSRGGAHRSRPPRPPRRTRRGLRPYGSALGRSVSGADPPAAGSRLADASSVGRWALLPPVEADPTLRAHALADVLLDRYGVLTRGSVAAEQPPGGFAGVYRVLAAAEETGTLRRGYFVEGLGASQFATTGAVDRLRAGRDGPDPETLLLAATDPANPYGAALPWPRHGDGEAGHRPGRKAGALVALHDGELLLYVERGGRAVLTYTDEADRLAAAASALADAVHGGRLGPLTVEKADDEVLLGSGHPLDLALISAGFHATPRGVRIRR